MERFLNLYRLFIEHKDLRLCILIILDNDVLLNFYAFYAYKYFLILQNIVQILIDIFATYFEPTPFVILL